jgi:hypothetical protein
VQPLLHLSDGHIGLRCDQGQQVPPIRIELRAPRVTLLAGSALSHTRPTHHTIVVASPIPNRSAAARADVPASIT